MLKTFGYLPRISNWLDLVYNAKWQIDTPQSMKHHKLIAHIAILKIAVPSDWDESFDQSLLLCTGETSKAW